MQAGATARQARGLLHAGQPHRLRTGVFYRGWPDDVIVHATPTAFCPAAANWTPPDAVPCCARPLAPAARSDNWDGSEYKVRTTGGGGCRPRGVCGPGGVRARSAACQAHERIGAKQYACHSCGPRLLTPPSPSSLYLRLPLCRPTGLALQHPDLGGGPVRAHAAVRAVVRICHLRRAVGLRRWGGRRRGPARCVRLGLLCAAGAGDWRAVSRRCWGAGCEASTQE